MAHSFTHVGARAPFLILMAGMLACSESPVSGGADNPDPPDPTPQLRRELELTPNCYNWPADEFSFGNHVENTRVSVAEAEQAIDFTLKDTDGVTYKLSELLETRPVLMVFGAFT
jgi:hypothetical protein